jgi:shikimate dehydrogenase/3-dehydroquinate dehydratase type I
MLCAIIAAHNEASVLLQLSSAKKFSPELFEWRLDYFEKLSDVRRIFDDAMLATLRSIEHGGKSSLPLEDRHKLLMELLPKLQPEWIDLEYPHDLSLIAFAKKQCKESKILLSYHGSSKDLDSILPVMDSSEADLCKIAVKTESSLESLKLLKFVQDNSKKAFAIALGKYGLISRLIAQVLGKAFTYCRIEDTAGLAQYGIPSIDELKEVYHLDRVDEKTKLLGLITGCSSKSISDITHNYAIEAYGLHAIYMKIETTEQDLMDVLSLLYELGFAGLSVTMPFKKAVMPFLTEIDGKAKQMGAVNTLTRCEKGFFGSNTDGCGLLFALEKHLPLKASKVALLGAGGASLAAGYSLQRYGANVSFVTRHETQGKAAAEALGCSFLPLGVSLKGFDLVINATGANIELPEIEKRCFVMDMTTKPKMTPFLRQAAEIGCPLIFGYEMFAAQAALQFQQWFPHKSFADLQNTLEKKALSTLQ